ncbi:MAG: endonuclease [Ktedonobacteraceae bacterium]|nr:endonuclease [Ktedonobacteraceae bacterium]
MESVTVYLIHFERPFKHARHYLGATTNLEKRLRLHQRGLGSCLMAAVVKAGIPWTVTRTWVTSFDHEQALKAQKNGPRLCPVCLQARIAQ